MGYGDDDERGAGAPPAAAWQAVDLVTEALVRLVGVVLLILGLWVAVNVVLEAWQLYQEPARIERIAARLSAVAGAPASADTAGGGLDQQLALLLAWPLALLLLLLLGRLAFWAVAHGGMLALGSRGPGRRR
jgi:hypothetical protein